MPTRKLNKPPEGAKMKETADMIAWRQEFEEMDMQTHKARLKSLGLDDDDIAEFEEMEEGAPLEEELMKVGPFINEETKAAKKKVVKKTVKK